MEPKRVVLLTNGSLMAGGIRQLLEGVDGITLSVIAAHDPLAATQIVLTAPHIVVLDAGDVWLEQGAIARLLLKLPEVKVISLTPERPDMDIYRMERVLKTTVEGLLAAIQSE